MKILVIFAHPSEKSYNHALLEAFLKGLKEGGHEADILDLYRDHFDPVLQSTDSSGGLEEDIKAYQKRIQEADCLAFIFPTFWYRGPAMLEGFIDRVFTPHFAYQYVSFIGSFKRPQGLLSDKKAVVIQTFGGSSWYYRFIFRTPWSRFRAVLKFFGIRKIIYQPCYRVPFTNDQVRLKYLEKVSEIGRKLK